MISVENQWFVLGWLGVALTFGATFVRMLLEISLIRHAKESEEEVWRVNGAIEPSPYAWVRWHHERGKIVAELRRNPISPEVDRINRRILFARVAYIAGVLVFAYVFGSVFW